MPRGRSGVDVKEFYTVQNEPYQVSSRGVMTYTCKSCDKSITGTATRLKAHLLGTPKQGVRACRKVSQSVKDVLLEGEKRSLDMKEASLRAAPPAPEVWKPLESVQAVSDFFNNPARQTVK